MEKDEQKKPYQYDDFPLYDGLSTRYSRANIEAWLSYFCDYFCTENAETKLIWALTKADILSAVAQQPSWLRKIFRLVGVQQMTFYEAAEVLNVRQRTAQIYWRSLVVGVTAIMCDREIYDVHSEPVYRYCYDRVGGGEYEHNIAIYTPRPVVQQDQ